MSSTDMRDSSAAARSPGGQQQLSSTPTHAAPGANPSQSTVPPKTASGAARAFECRTDNVKIISNILSALHKSSHSKKDATKDAGHSQVATVSVTNTGIKFTVEEAKSFQGNAFLQEELFQEFNCSTAHELFQINFGLFVDCLNIYGASAGFVTMHMTYDGYGSSLNIVLQDAETVTTECAVATMDADEVSNFHFRGHPVMNKVIMEAVHLRDAFNELDWSSTKVLILLSPDAPYFRLSTTTDAGICQVDYPKDSEIFEDFQCSKTQTNSYLLSHMQLAVRALQIAQKTQLRMNEVGVLSIQHMIKNEDKSISFVDFFVAPQEEEDE